MAKNPYIQYNGLDGESEGLDELKGLARLSPYFYIGGNDPAFMTVTGYDALFPEDEPIPLKQFRLWIYLWYFSLRLYLVCEDLIDKVDYHFKYIATVFILSKIWLI